MREWDPGGRLEGLGFCAVHGRGGVDLGRAAVAVAGDAEAEEARDGEDLRK